MHKLITFIFTGQNINFGNYSILTRSDVEKLHSKASLWSSFSGSVKKNLKPIKVINSIRGKRYFGPSQMSLLKLIVHSLSIIAVFKYNVILRSTLMIIVLAYLNLHLGSLAIISQILISNIVGYSKIKDQIISNIMQRFIALACILTAGYVTPIASHYPDGGTYNNLLFYNATKRLHTIFEYFKKYRF